MSKYLPTYVYRTIYDIDFVTLYEQGKKVILFDLDNTIATYQEIDPTYKHIEFNKKLKNIGFKVYIVSNNKGSRVERFCNNFIVDGILTNAKKPFNKKIKKFLLENNIKKSETLFVGDQTLTDIACANNTGIDSVLVKSIDRTTEKWYTKINRIRERIIIKKLVNKQIKNSKEVYDIINERSNINE